MTAVDLELMKMEEISARPDSTRRATLRRRFASVHVRRGIVVGSVVWLGLALACGPPAGSGGGGGMDSQNHEFEFARSTKYLIRVATRTGQVWRVPISGDGGWQPTGDAPESDGKVETPGRYRVNYVPPGRGPGGRRVGQLLRMDLEGGRVWVMDSEGDTDWMLIRDDANPPTRNETRIPAANPDTGMLDALGELDSMGAVDLPGLSEGQNPMDLPTDQVEYNLAAFRDAIEKPHLPSEIRVWATQQLALYDMEQSGPILMRALDDGDPLVVVAAIQAAQTIAYAPAVPRILQLQQHSDSAVRAAAKEAVTQLN